MARVLGFILGIVLAAAIVLSVFESSVLRELFSTTDAPEAPAETPVQAEEVYVVKAEKWPEPAQIELPTQAPEPVPDEMPVANPAEVVEAVADDEPTPEPSIERELPAAPARQWFGFWYPFKSELSADGFRQRLERVTSLDYRVVEVERGQYQVAFAFTEEEERLKSLAEIEAATGLTLKRVAF